jgi:hypothetical protein
MNQATTSPPISERARFIEAAELTKHFGDVIAVERISFEIFGLLKRYER